MKKVLLFLIFFCFIVVTGCSKKISQTEFIEIQYTRETHEIELPDFSLFPGFSYQGTSAIYVADKFTLDELKISNIDYAIVSDVYEDYDPHFEDKYGSQTMDIYLFLKKTDYRSYKKTMKEIIDKGYSVTLSKIDKSEIEGTKYE